LGFDATTSVLRSDFGLGAFAPAVSDAVEIMISVEAQKAE
jgi:polyisoprenoid-binding protein YceI